MTQTDFLITGATGDTGVMGISHSVPQLMMGFTQPGQAKESLVKEVQEEIDYSR